jgi:urea carboxylase
MEKLNYLLIANRGEIAVRICRMAKRLIIHTIAIYTEADAASAHVAIADEAILLSGPEFKAYRDGEQIIKIAVSQKADVIIPGYGFLSENAEFSRQIFVAGKVFAGPNLESMEFSASNILRRIWPSGGCAHRI